MDISYTWVIIGVVIVVLGWIGFGVWKYLEYRKEQQIPPEEKVQKTEHLDKVKKSFEDYAKKMTDFKLKPYEKKKKSPHDWS
jgi:cytoskeletal protein RodZ